MCVVKIKSFGRPLRHHLPPYMLIHELELFFICTLTSRTLCVPSVRLANIHRLFVCILHLNHKMLMIGDKLQKYHEQSLQYLDKYLHSIGGNNWFGLGIDTFAERVH